MRIYRWLLCAAILLGYGCAETASPGALTDIALDTEVPDSVAPDAVPIPDAKPAPDTTTPLDTNPTPDVPTDDCVTDLEYFEETIWSNVLSQDCGGCHTEGSLADDTRFVLDLTGAPDALQKNFEMFRILAMDHSFGESIILMKPTGQIAHSGGQRFYVDSEVYTAFEQFVRRTEQPGGCEDPGLAIPVCEQQPVNAGPVPLRRLTDTEYANTIQDLLGVSVEEAAQKFPRTAIGGGYSKYPTANVVTAARTEAIFDAAEHVAAMAIEDLDAIIQCGESNELACVVDFIKDLGRRAFRRPLTNAEVGTLFGVYQQCPTNTPLSDKVARIIETTIQSPQFLYIHAEEGTAVEGTNDVVWLSDYAIASRLSYFMWETMPDEELMAEAAAGTLNTPESLTTQVDRMLADPRGRRMASRFHEEWMRLYRIPTIDKDAKLFPTYSAALGEAMIEEIRRVTEHTIFDQAGTFEALMSTPTSFINPLLAEHYELDGTNLNGDGNWQSVEMDPAIRGGLLSRAAFMTAHSYPSTSSPIHRGHFFLEQMLCQVLVIPPFIVPSVPEVPNGTIRERLALHREDAVCASCHIRMDPMGLSFEHYDAIGRYRETYDTGQDILTQDTIAEPDIVFSDGPDLVEQLIQRPDVRACYATHWFRYMNAREELAEDDCSLETIVDGFEESGGSVQGLIHALVQSDSFRVRRAINLTEEATDETP